VLSEDQSIIEWTVVVKKRKWNHYKEAVCYEGDLLKYYFLQKRRSCFKKRRDYLSTQTINNGELILVI
jgi:hypothetical protein